MIENEELGQYIETAVKLIGSQLIYDFGEKHDLEYVGANSDKYLKRMKDFKNILDFLIEFIELKKNKLNEDL